MNLCKEWFSMLILPKVELRDSLTYVATLFLVIFRTLFVFDINYSFYITFYVLNLSTKFCLTFLSIAVLGLTFGSSEILDCSLLF